MIRISPIYEKERRAADRSRMFAGGILGFSAVMILFAMTVFSSMVTGMQESGRTNYAQMLQIYIVLSMMEGVLCVAVMPALSGAGISVERERGALFVMRMSGIRPSDLILGKFLACMNTMAVILFAGFPALSLVFVYGGVRLSDSLQMFGVELLAAAYFCSAGLFCSIFVRRRTTGMIAAYLAVFLLCGLPILIHYLPSILFVGHESQAFTGSIPWYEYLLLASPIFTLYVLLDMQAGSREFLYTFLGTSYSRSGFAVRNWVAISLCLYAVCTIAFLVGAIVKLRTEEGTNHVHLPKIGREHSS